VANLLSLEDFTFRYAGATRDAVRGISLTVREGEVIVLAGPSGCGKSTLLRALIGLIPHMYAGDYRGRVFVSGMDVPHTSISSLATEIGFVFQNPENQIFMFSVERDIAFGLENLGLPRGEIRARVDWVLKLLELEALAARAPHELSDGQKQRVALAGVLAMRPKLLVLDEPTSLLDPRSAAGLISLVHQLNRNLGITILVVEHRLDLLAGVASRILVMNDGALVLDGPPRRVLADPQARASAISVPTVAQLSHLLGAGPNELALNVDELLRAISLAPSH
jgi:energy-coupling factor transporter ATP-binding protein EcfA2